MVYGDEQCALTHVVCFKVGRSHAITQGGDAHEWARTTSRSTLERGAFDVQLSPLDEYVLEGETHQVGDATCDQSTSRRVLLLCYLPIQRIFFKPFET